MIKLVFILCVVVYKVQCYFAPYVFAGPGAVSHQSRIDVQHSPGLISAPLIYSPATAIFAGTAPVKPQETILAPVVAAGTVLTPIAYTFFNNLPLARALRHPISIDKAQAEASGQYVGMNMEELDSDKKNEQIAVVKVPEHANGNIEGSVETSTTLLGVDVITTNRIKHEIDKRE